MIPRVTAVLLVCVVSLCVVQTEKKKKEAFEVDQRLQQSDAFFCQVAAQPVDSLLSEQNILKRMTKTLKRTACRCGCECVF